MEQMGSRLPLPRSASWDACDMPGVLGEWVVDERAEGSDRAVLHLHGGAYSMGSPRTHRGLGATLSRTARAPVLLPEYRLAPEDVFPAALDDAMAAYRWLVDDHGTDPARIAVTGDSAGGGLGLALLVRLRDEGQPLPACYVGMSPWTDLAGTGPSLTELDGVDPWLTAALIQPAARAYAGEAALDHPLVSPLYADLRGLPPMLVHVGGDEILRDDACRLVDRARDAGVDASLGSTRGSGTSSTPSRGSPNRGTPCARSVGSSVVTPARTCSHVMPPRDRPPPPLTRPTSGGLASVHRVAVEEGHRWLRTRSCWARCRRTSFPPSWPPST
jgi:epsilon-lactone hydrolase